MTTEIEIRDALRRSGITADVAASEFLVANGVNRSVIQSLDVRGVVSTKVNGRVYFDFPNDPKAAQTLAGMLSQRGVTATVDSDTNQKNGSSLYIDRASALLRFVTENYPDITTTPQALQARVITPIKAVADQLAHLNIGTFEAAAALGSLNRLAELKTPLTNEQAREAFRIGRQALSMLDGVFFTTPSAADAAQGLRSALRDPLEVLADLSRLGQTAASRQPVSRAPSGTSSQLIDVTLPDVDAKTHFDKNPAEATKLAAYKQALQKNGSLPDLLKTYKGTVSDLFNDMTNPKSPLAHALKTVNENSMENAQILDQRLSRLYTAALPTAGKERVDILNQWDAVGRKPYHSLPVSKAMELYNKSLALDPDGNFNNHSPVTVHNLIKGVVGSADVMRAADAGKVGTRRAETTHQVTPKPTGG